MSQVPVKWVDEDDFLTPEQVREIERQWDSLVGTYSCKFIPVVPLSALREVVEGLKLLSMQDPQRSHPLWSEWVNGPDYRSKSFKMWLAQRLLASLGEVEK